MYRSLLSGLIILIALPIVLWAADPTAYVLNTNGETLSKINLTTGAVTNNIITIGSVDQSYPNQMVVRDTLMYVTVSGTNEIQVINLNTEETAYYINTGSQSNPYWIGFIDEQDLYVSLLLNNSVARIDYVSGAIIDEIEVGKSPEGALMLGDYAYIACSGFDFDTYQYDPGEVYVLDIESDTVLNQISVGLNPQFMALDSLGRIHVVCTGDYFSVFGAIYIIDPALGIVVDSINIGGTPGQITIGPDNIAYIAAAGFSQEGYVYSYHCLTGEIFHSNANPIEVDLNCMTVQAYQDSSVFTASFTDYVNVIDSSGSIVNSYAVGAGPQHIVFNYQPGDANGDFDVNILDVTHIVNWLYKDGDNPRWPRYRANVNADYTYNLLDVTYLINFLYKAGPRPKASPRWL